MYIRKYYMVHIINGTCTCMHMVTKNERPVSTHACSEPGHTLDLSPPAVTMYMLFHIATMNKFQKAM